MTRVTCFHCGNTYEFVERVPRKETCSKCGSDLHCCKNCTFYDTSAPKECREPVAEYVRYKDRANFCDYFEPKSANDPSGTKSSSQDDARKAWDKLFKK